MPQEYMVINFKSIKSKLKKKKEKETQREKKHKIHVLWKQ